ncbi:hypothetical protein AKI39_12450 [Bordetella sp. H567]|nr:hypothetical protein AKI39_12450 [Bordetella sp. H567]
MKRLGLLLVFFALMGLDTTRHATAADRQAATHATSSTNHTSVVAAPLKKHGREFHRLAGRGARRCDDPLIEQDKGACSE